MTMSVCWSHSYVCLPPDRRRVALLPVSNCLRGHCAMCRTVTVEVSKVRSTIRGGPQNQILRTKLPEKEEVISTKVIFIDYCSVNRALVDERTVGRGTASGPQFILSY